MEILALFILLFAFFFPLVGDRAPYHTCSMAQERFSSSRHPGITDLPIYNTISATSCQNEFPPPIEDRTPLVDDFASYKQREEEPYLNPSRSSGFFRGQDSTAGGRLISLPIRADQTASAARPPNRAWDSLQEEGSSALCE